jgi:hypothetical protein
VVWRIGFVYYSTHPVETAKLRDTCEQLGLTVTDVLHVIDAADPRYTLEGLACASPDSKRRLVEFLKQQKKLQLCGLVVDCIQNERDRTPSGFYPSRISASTPCSPSTFRIPPFLEIASDPSRMSSDSMIRTGPSSLSADSPSSRWSSVRATPAS